MKVFWIILIILVVLGVAWVGLGIFNSCIGPDNKGPSMPDQAEASHSVYIENTGNLLLASDYEVYGSEPGSRLFILHGYWELRGQKFKFLEGDIVLDEAIFGEITVERRNK